MKTRPIVAAEIAFAGDGAPPRAPKFDDLYHPREGALEQARAVFLAGNGLPARWRGRDRFTILETGFGLGNNFLATWAAWRDDPQRCARLHFVSLEKHPLSRADLARAHAGSPLPGLARELIDAWPPLTPNLHQLAFDSGRVQLLLGLGDAEALVREIVASADAFYLDGFAPARNPAMWSPELMRALARLAAPGATAATWSAARAVREALAAAGFVVEVARPASPLGKRDITIARYAPRFLAPRPPGRALPIARPVNALIVGAGLAGAAAARALAAQGIECTVLERAAQPASQASGNPAGLMHGTVGAADTHYTRLHRSASFSAARWRHDSTGGAMPSGLLRLSDALDIEAMRSLAAAQGLPPQYLRALDAAEASARAGLALGRPAWWFPQGGWADPQALVRAVLDGTPNVRWRSGVEVASIGRSSDGLWHAFDRDGASLGEASLLVLANADDALPLAALPRHWVSRSRGQLSWLDAPRLAPAVPLAGGGYVLALPDGRLLFGATQQAGDDDVTVREADDAANLDRATRLLGDSPWRDGAALHGRVAWRVATRDRLPLVGSVPDLQAPLPARRDAPRLVPRRDGLFMLCALGSRGLTTAALAGELIAAQAVGAPWPIEADLADAIDPARFVLRPPHD